MKGLLKGIRYISQVFDQNEQKGSEMQIGYPTDVKHVAHIGWDGPSVNSPSWKKEFKSPHGSSSPPLALPVQAAAYIKAQTPFVQWVSEDSSQRSTRVSNSNGRDNLPELPRSSRRQSSTGGVGVGSPARDKPEKPKTKKSSKSKDSTNRTKPTRQSTDPNKETALLNLPDIPKKTRRQKSKDNSLGGSVRSRSRANQSPPAEIYQSPLSDPGSGSGSRSMNQEVCLKTFEEEGRNGI